MVFGKTNYVKVIFWGLPKSICYYFQAEGYGNCSCETYLSPECFFEQLKTNTYKTDSNDVFAGAYVINKETVLNDNWGLSFKAPLMDVNLQPYQISKFVERIMIENGTINQCGSMDQVGIELYVEYWRNAGAPIGKIQEDGKTIVWEEKKSISQNINNQLTLPEV